MRCGVFKAEEEKGFMFRATVVEVAHIQMMVLKAELGKGLCE
jgi:hypothetical protein